MDGEWLRRLQFRPEGNAFAQYARLLRLMSGMSEVGVVRALAKASEQRRDEERERSLRADPSVVSFVRFLESVPELDRGIVLAVISENLFPNGTPGWFSCNCPDPRVSPADSLRRVQQNADLVLDSLSRVVPQMPADPVHGWDEDAPTHARWEEDFVRSLLSDAVCDGVRRAGEGRGLVLDSHQSYRVKVELIADGQKISVEKFYLHKKTTKEDFVTVLKRSFANCLVGIPGVLFERLNDKEVGDGITLFETLPEVTKFEYRVVWEDLVRQHGRTRLAKVFEVPGTLLSALPKDGPRESKEESVAPCFLEVSVVLEGVYTLCQKRYHAPLKGTSEQLIEGIVNDFDKVLFNTRGTLTNMNGGKIPKKVVISDMYPEEQSFAYHVCLDELLLNNSPDRLRSVFQEADCLQNPERYLDIKKILDRHLCTFGPSRPAQSSEVPSEPSVGLSRAEESPIFTGDGVPKSKAKPARRSVTPVEEKAEVLKVRLFIESERLMLRYEKVFRNTTGQDIKERLWKKIPEQYQSLDCHLFVGESSVQLELHEKLLDNLRPMEIMIDYELLVDRMTKEEILVAKSVLMSALAQYDAAVMVPGHPAHGPTVPNVHGGDSRGVTRPLSTNRPVFADHITGSPPSAQSGSKRPRRDAMATSAASSAAVVMNEVRIGYHWMPALTEKQNKDFDNLASRISWALRGRELRQVDLVFERENQDPIPFSTMSLDQCLCAVCAAWKLPMGNAGIRWQVCIQGRPEVINASATVFLAVSDIVSEVEEILCEDNFEKERSRSKGRREYRRNEDKDRAKRRRRHSREEESRSRYSGGVNRCEVATCEGTKASLNEQASDYFVALRKLAVKVYQGDVTESPHHGVTLTRPDSVDCNEEGDEVKECSPTLLWTQNVQEGDHFEVNSTLQPLDQHDRVLRDLTKSVVSYGSESGCLLKAFPLVVQKLCEGSCDHGAYMVYPGSQDFCVRCFNPFGDGDVPSYCPHCGVPNTRTLFPSVHAVGSPFPEMDVFMRYVPRPQSILAESGRFTVEGLVGPRFSELLWRFSVDGFRGTPGSEDCFLLWDGEETLEEDLPVVLFNGVVVGVFGGSPLFGFPFKGSSSALVRRPRVGDDVRVLDLFAGIGGWEYALDLISPALGTDFSVSSDVVSIELDPVPARTLALNSKRVLIEGAHCSSLGGDGFVVLGSVCDADWYGTSLCRPFTDLVFSSPCQPWSRAGNVLGFASDDGLLLAHAIGLLLLFRPLRAAGENVAGLSEHPHWGRVKHLMSFLPHQFRVQTTDLRFLSPMARKRLFLLFQLGGVPTVVPHVDLKPKHWLETGCGFLDAASFEDVTPTQEQFDLLSDKSFLPLQERTKSFQSQEKDGLQVLRRRLAGAILPTLVASYRFQCELPEKNLRDKGILTWLVSEDSGTYPPRFLEHLEAARLLGFPFELSLPSQEGISMKLLGNSVSPLQGAVALFRLFGGIDTGPLLKELKFRLFGQPKIGCLVRQHFGDFCKASLSIGRPERTWLSVKSWAVSCDSVLSAVIGTGPFATENFPELLAIGKSVQVDRCKPYLTEDDLVFFLKLGTVHVDLLSDAVVGISLSPFTRLSDLGYLVAGGVADLPGSFSDPLWNFYGRKIQVFLNHSLVVPQEVRFLFGEDVRLWPFQNKVSFLEAIDQVFPFCIAKLATITQNGREVVLTDFPARGETYTVTFDPLLVNVPPFGNLWVDPLTKIGSLSEFLAWKFYHGKASVRLTANGRLVDPQKKICFALKVGPLRGKVYALPGGVGYTLSTIIAELASTLVEHGHPKKDVEKKANEVYDKLGHAECKKILESRSIWPLLKSACTQAKVVLVPLSHRGNKEARDEIFEQDPWANYSESGKKGRGKKVAEKVKSDVARVDMTFFHAAKQPLQQIGLNQLLQGHPGLLVSNLEEFLPHFPVVLKSSTSVGPAGVLLIGASLNDLSVGSSARISDIVVPGWIGPHSAAIKCVLLCCGDEDVETYREVSLNVVAPPADHQVIQYHIYKDTCSKWDVLSKQGFEFFLKEIGFGQLMAISQTWSQNFFYRGKKVAANEAEYFHGFLRVEMKVVPALLKLGGFDGFFPSPRTLQRANDPAYRVLHLRGFSLADARAVLPGDSFGLTRSKQGYGIRLAAEKYAGTKAKLFPHSVDSSESDEGGSGKFHLLGIPSGIDRSTIKAALRTLKWEAKVSKSSGFRAWTVFSAVDPPTRSFPLHAATVVVLRVDQAQQGPVLATSSKQKFGQKLRLPVTQTSKAENEVSSGIATKYSQLADQSNAKVTELENKFQKLSDAVDKSQQENAQRFDAVEHEVKTIGQQVTKQSADLDNKLQSMFDKLFANQQSCIQQLEKSNEQAITSLRAEYQSGYTELKEILANSPKARKVVAPVAP